MSLDHVGKCRTGGGANIEVRSFENGHSEKWIGANRELRTYKVGLSGKWVAASREPRTFELGQRRSDLCELRTANCELFNFGR